MNMKLRSAMKQITALRSIQPVCSVQTSNCATIYTGNRSHLYSKNHADRYKQRILKCFSLQIRRKKSNSCAPTYTHTHTNTGMYTYTDIKFRRKEKGQLLYKQVSCH